MIPYNASSINSTIRSYNNSYFKSDLRILKIFFLFLILLGTWDITANIANFFFKCDFKQLINIAWEDKFSDFDEIATRELPGAK